MDHRVKIANAWYKQVALILGVFVLSILGWHLLLRDDLMAKTVGFVCVIVFAGGGGIAIARRMAGRTHLYMSRVGLEIQTRGCTGPVVLPWAEIDEISVRTIDGVKLVCLALGSYDGIVTRSALDQMELIADTREFELVKLQEQLPIMDFRPEHSAAMDRRIWREEGAKVFVDTLRASRNYLGAEFMLPRNMLDRSAEQFASFLIKRRKLLARTF